MGHFCLFSPCLGVGVLCLQLLTDEAWSAQGTPGWGSESINQISGPFEES